MRKLKPILKFIRKNWGNKIKNPTAYEQLPGFYQKQKNKNKCIFTD